MIEPDWSDVRDFTKGLLKFLGVVLLLAGVAAAVLYFFFVRVVEVGHNAMAPTIMVGDRVLVWRGHDFELGEAVLCAHPSQPGRFVLGRVVARTGQTVEISRGGLRINGESPDRDARPPFEFYDAERGESYQVEWGIETVVDQTYTYMTRARRRPMEMRPRQVTGAAVFLLSDNRSYAGEDSRTFGQVNLATCEGHVFMRLTAADSPDVVGNSHLDLID
ncbi:MAG TPA: signal peptidase I [Myxococcales bacterium]|nr:signal peptidase I [Myxococcales bacterium]